MNCGRRCDGGAREHDRSHPVLLNRPGHEIRDSLPVFARDARDDRIEPPGADARAVACGWFGIRPGSARGSQHRLRQRDSRMADTLATASAAHYTDDSFSCSGALTSYLYRGMDLLRPSKWATRRAGDTARSSLGDLARQRARQIFAEPGQFTTPRVIQGLRAVADGDDWRLARSSQHAPLHALGGAARAVSGRSWRCRRRCSCSRQWG